MTKLCAVLTLVILSTAGGTSARLLWAADSAAGYRIAGIVNSKIDGHILGGSRVFLRSVTSPEKVGSVTTGEDGKFQFTGLPAGKYSLAGEKRGFTAASYEQHDEFSTAIVTGDGVDTENLQMRLAPASVISGKVWGDGGEPVRHAMVTLYYNDHSRGIDHIQRMLFAQTDDQGAYELTSLRPGTYYLSAGAEPWYAVHPPAASASVGELAAQNPEENFDRNLDVSYPLTYYADATDADGASPIPIRGGERLEVDFHLSAVASLHLLLQMPVGDDKAQVYPQIEQPTLDGPNTFQVGMNPVSPGVMEITGVPAGRYDIRVSDGVTSSQLEGVDLSRDGQIIDAGNAEALSKVQISAKVLGETSLPAQLFVVLRSEKSSTHGAMDQFGEKKDLEFRDIQPGRYEVLVGSNGKAYNIAAMSASGGEVSGRSVTVPAGASVAVSLTLTGDTREVKGIARRAGKPMAGAMVVLVPKLTAGNRSLFRRDQSDLDGTFSLRDVVSGAYTALAIEDGWDLDWSRPEALTPYLLHGQAIEIPAQGGHTITLKQPVEVLTK